MKKWLISFAVVIVLMLIAFYFIIPSRLVITNQLTIQCTEAATKRFLFDNTQWNKWWPGEKKDSSFTYRNDSYALRAGYYNSAAIVIQHNGKFISSVVNVLSSGKNAATVTWQSETGEYKNPFSRIIHYLKANELKQSIDDILSNLKTFLEKPENVYGMKIEQIIVRDTFLVSTQKTLPAYPATADVYALISQLQTYIKQQAGKETNPPMLHVLHEDSATYTVKVAIPVDKEIKGNGTIFFKEMVKGNILVAEIKGGRYTVSHAMDMLKTYVLDNQKTSPAIPFESLVTDRSAVSDTSKWVTKIYYPVL
ncbi:GyrI-like domain-containing protein [Danxiaibacter flavus]|uniref:GyrI-like domain-containing protein n=1 Tax=Danxiaibacter flavus TaxID=3049108 RepID=A0ABV3ZEU0_9BACT|nr:GyrI-like domain-containing protein [Chitinophagaceae bacterium DXS]